MRLEIGGVNVALRMGVAVAGQVVPSSGVESVSWASPASSVLFAEVWQAVE
jgi:hypothetical protein